METMPVHRRARGALGQDQGDAADPIIRVRPVLEDVESHRTDLEHLGRLFLVKLHRDGTPERHLDDGIGATG